MLYKVLLLISLLYFFPINKAVFAQEPVVSFFDDFELDKNWTLAEEIVGGNICYGSGIAEIDSSSSIAYQGIKSLKVEANHALSPKSNHVIAVQKLSNIGQNGKYTYETYFYLDPETIQTGQAGPEISVQNTRKINDQFLTNTGAVQYRLNPYDNPTNIWAIWAKQPDGRVGWTTFLRQPLEAGKWYYLSISMNFDTKTYSRFTLRGNGLNVDMDVLQYSIADETKWDEEAFDITLESENLWNNCGTAGNFHFNVFYDNTRLTLLPESCLLKNRGDADCNNVVNLSDFFIWRREFLQSLSGGSSTKQSDFNNDGVVDISDFFAWRRGFLNR